MFEREPKLTVDVIIPDAWGHVILIARGHKPFEGKWCLPGGMVDEDETVEEAALREVREEIGIDVRIDRVFAIRSKPGRDPRGHYVSIVLIAHPTSAEPRTTEEATMIMHAAPDAVPEMAFDHEAILRDYQALGGGNTNVVLA
ncbi:MAG: NUDIX hydrolase [Flavobacteriales bacterium]